MDRRRLLLASLALGSLPACTSTPASARGRDALALAQANSGDGASDPRGRAFTSRRILIERQAGPDAGRADVILIPGLASTGAVWQRTARRLAPRHRVHIVTVRGFGEVPAEDNAAGSLSEPLSREIGRYIAEQRLRRPALIGHSLGGQLALRLAAEQPRRVGRVMTVDASPFFPALINADTQAVDVEPVARIIYQTIQFLGDDVLASGGRSLGLELGGASDALFNAVGWQGGDRRVLSQALYEAMTQDLRPRLPRITAPVTVVYGSSADDRTPRRRADALFRLAFAGLPTPARFEPIEGAEHMVMIDRFGPFMAAVDRFLA